MLPVRDFKLTTKLENRHKGKPQRQVQQAIQHKKVPELKKVRRNNAKPKPSIRLPEHTTAAIVAKIISPILRAASQHARSHWVNVKTPVSIPAKAVTLQ